MHLHRCLSLIIVLMTGNTASALEAETIDRISGRLDAYHAGHDSSDSPELRVVYFHAAGTPPQKEYEARLHRILTDIQAFYSSEMERLGFAGKSLPLELRNGDLVVHRVQGREPINAYSNDTVTSKKIIADTRSHLASTIDVERDFILFICGLCSQLENGSYAFNSPYFGMPGLSPRGGMCFAADCEMQDTLHYSDEESRFVYREHLGKFDKTLGAFNRLYIGGIAHELGHGLGLPHTKEYPWQKPRIGTALMGSGNHTWREELFGKKGSFLTLSSGMRLLSHPLFTRSNRDRFVKVKASASSLRFQAGKQAKLNVSGRLNATPQAYAVLVDTDPEGNSDYNTNTWVGEVSEKGDFTVPIYHLQNGTNELRITALHMNGSTTRINRMPFQVNDGHPLSLNELNHQWAFEQAELAYMDDRMEDLQQLVEKATLEGDSSRLGPLQHLSELATGQPEPKSLTESEETSAYLSDVRWREATVGWGQPARNHYFTTQQVRDGVCLMPGGKFHAKGLYAHAPARHVYDLQGRWEAFSATVGLQEGVHAQGSAVFVVMGDNRELFRSQKVTEIATEDIHLDIKGIQTLSLIVESGKETNSSCWAVWGSPKVER